MCVEVSRRGMGGTTWLMATWENARKQGQEGPPSQESSTRRQEQALGQTPLFRGKYPKFHVLAVTILANDLFQVGLTGKCLPKVIPTLLGMCLFFSLPRPFPRDLWRMY